MFGRYICEKCGAECDPNEIHNGICDDCRDADKEVTKDENSKAEEKET